jgi:hypothetical protein
MHIQNIVQGKINKVEKKSTKKVDEDSLFEIAHSEPKRLANVTTAARPNITTAWMIQEFDPYEEDQQKMKERGRKLMGHLNDIRIGILNGAIAKDNLLNLQRDLEESNIELSHPELKETLDDIRLRAAVELAKFDMSGN